MLTDRLDIAGYAVPVEGLGPGRRLAFWVRGCRLRCAGCMSPELWQSGESTRIEEIVATFVPMLSAVDGLTISGGEPFLQAAALSVLIDRLRRERDIEVLAYSGYTLEELRAMGEAEQGLLARLDLLIDGPFRVKADNTRQWRGSDNQRVWLLTPRAQAYRADADAPMPEQRPVQLQMLAPDRYRVIGIPRRGDMVRLRALLAERGVVVRAEHE